MDKLLGKLDRVPIRWRLALASAGLTAPILALFALVFGLLITNQLRSSFDDNLRDTAGTLRQELPRTLSSGELPPEVFEQVFTGGAAVRLLGPDGRTIASTRNAPDLGAPTEEVHEANGYRVASEPVLIGSQLRASFLQYGEPASRLHGNIARVRLFLVLGVLGGTALALLAGLAVARRAMAPIAALTNAAKGVARTRDPAVQLPKPVADDEVADLARTLEQMLMALDQARGETESALARQREFVADASHELRTPLTSVLANLELLEAALAGRGEAGPDLDLGATLEPARAGEAAEMASSALRSSQRMRRLVGDLLLLARADAGRRAPRRATDLAAVARDAAAEVAPLADRHELELDVEPGAIVDGSPDDLHRLALNLLENAVHHTPPGTAVRARVRREDGTAVLVVEDEGPGVPPEQRGRVFDRFVRGPGDAGPGGSGLGLAIVRAVAESHGGEVALEDGAGRPGARFVVRLPASEAAAEEAPSGAGVAG